MRDKYLREPPALFIALLLANYAPHERVPLRAVLEAGMTFGGQLGQTVTLLNKVGYLELIRGQVQDLEPRLALTAQGRSALRSHLRVVAGLT